MKTHKIQISTKTKKYSIFIGSKLIAKINKILSSQQLSFSKILIVIDKNIPSKFKLKLIKNLKSGVKKTYIFKASEQNKNQRNVDLIQNISPQNLHDIDKPIKQTTVNRVKLLKQPIQYPGHIYLHLLAILWKKIKLRK